MKSRLPVSGGCHASATALMTLFQICHIQFEQTSLSDREDPNTAAAGEQPSGQQKPCLSLKSIAERVLRMLSLPEEVSLAVGGT